MSITTDLSTSAPRQAAATTSGPIRSSERQQKVGLPLLLTLALLSAIAPFATDLYLPAFPEMVGALSTTASGVQLSLTAFLVGAGLGQVAFGPISDRIGRRGPLIVGTVLFVVASIGAAMAPTIGALIAFRLGQGLFGAAGMVIGRAIISDQAHGRAAARAFSLMMVVGGIAPIIAPFLGSTLAGSIGWRGLLWIVAGIGLVALAAVLLIVRETRTRDTVRADARTDRGRRSLHDLTSRVFLANAVAYAFAFATLMAYIAASPFLYQNLMGLSTLQYGLAFALNAVALTAASTLSARLTYRFPIQRLAAVGFALNLLAVATVLATALLGVPTIWLGLPILVAVGSLGLVLGNTTAIALAPIPRSSSGTASAVLGLLQFTLAGVISPLVSIGGESSALPMAIVMLASAGIAASAFALGSRRRGRPGTSAGLPATQEGD